MNSNPPTNIDPTTNPHYYNPGTHFIPPSAASFGQPVQVMHGPPGLEPPTPSGGTSVNAGSNTGSPSHSLAPSGQSPLGLSSLAAAITGPSQSMSPNLHALPTFTASGDIRSHSPVPNGGRTSAGGTSASHHQISAKRKELHRAEYARHMKNFWAKQKELIEKTDYKKLKHDLPLARIKKIMKSDDEVRMISAEVPILFSKACELFILDLTMRAWAHTADTNRRTLQRSDVADAIMEGEGMDFLVDIVPREEETLQSREVRRSDSEKEPSTNNGNRDSRGDRDDRLDSGGPLSAGLTTDGLLRIMENQLNGQRAIAQSQQPQSMTFAPLSVQMAQPMSAMPMQAMQQQQ